MTHTPHPPADPGGPTLSLAASLRRLHPLLVEGGELPTARRHAPRAGPLTRLARPGVLMDCVGDPGSGAGLIALWLCKTAAQSHGELIVVDTFGDFYPPAAIAWGVDARRLLVVSPRNANEALAVVEESLRSPAVKAVWAPLERVPQSLFRRLLLAAENGHAFAALVRPTKQLEAPCCADYQFQFSAVPQKNYARQTLTLRVTQRRNRHGPVEPDRILQIDWRHGTIG